MKKLIERKNLTENLKTAAIYNHFEILINLLEKRELPNEIVDFINNEIEHLNSTSETNKDFEKTIKVKENNILKLLVKNLKVVPKNYYRKLWLGQGISIIGLPIGLTIGLITRNMGLLAAGIPIGMGIGVTIGSRLDKKAFIEGRQLDLE
jgi:hypothetical protein